MAIVTVATVAVMIVDRGADKNAADDAGRHARNCGILGLLRLLAVGGIGDAGATEAALH